MPAKILVEVIEIITSSHFEFERRTIPSLVHRCVGQVVVASQADPTRGPLVTQPSGEDSCMAIPPYPVQYRPAGHTSEQLDVKELGMGGII